MDTPHDTSGRAGRIMVVAFWLLLLAMLTWFFSGWMEREQNPNGHVAGVVTDAGAREVRLVQNRGGHYVAEGTINGQAAVFLVDTGASDVSIPASLAREAGLEPGVPVSYRTANGSIMAYRTTVDRLGLGTIELHNVRASINPAMEGDTILLGMTFLRRLELIQRGETLLLRQAP